MAGQLCTIAETNLGVGRYSQIREKSDGRCLGRRSGLARFQEPFSKYPVTRSWTRRLACRGSQSRLRSQGGFAGKAAAFQKSGLLEKANCESRKGEDGPKQTGILLVQDTIYVGRLANIGEVYLYAVIDTFSSFAFGLLHAEVVPEAAVAILHAEVFPFYRRKGICITAVQTDFGKEFCGCEMHIYALYLALKGVKHLQVRRMNDNWCIRYFRRAVKEFLADSLYRGTWKSMAEAQRDLNSWLDYYNNCKPCSGQKINKLPGMTGNTPCAFIDAYTGAGQVVKS